MLLSLEELMLLLLLLMEESEPWPIPNTTG